MVDLSFLNDFLLVSNMKEGNCSAEAHFRVVMKKLFVCSVCCLFPFLNLC